MRQEQVGRFIGILRREKGMTQEQLAGRLGVNHRSVSRWENGHCMPDFSLLWPLSEELGVSVQELLEGRKNETGGEEENILALILRLAGREQHRKMRRVRMRFSAGFFCLAAVLFQYQTDWLFFLLGAERAEHATVLLILFGIGLGAAGFWSTRQDVLPDMECLEVWTGRCRMKTAEEMFCFASRRQELERKKYKKVLGDVANALNTAEAVIFAAAGTEYFRNGLPMMWHVAVAVTEERLLIGGERTKGMLMTEFVTEAFALSDVTAIEYGNGIVPELVIKTGTDEITIGMESRETMERVGEELQSFLPSLHNSAARRP